ncbi:MAG: hypothetical protein ABWZ53_04330 [Actinomycetota bacterium]
MRRIAVFVALTVSLVACSDATTPPTGGGTTSSSPRADERRVGVYGSLITELAGVEPIEWRHVYVVTGLCANADEPMKPEGCDDQLSEAERTVLRERLDGMRLRFIDDPTSLYDDEWMQGPPRDVVLRLGPIVERAGEVRVGASYGCGGLCGGGTTYVLEEADGSWSVVGQRGGMWIA